MPLYYIQFQLLTKVLVLAYKKSSPIQISKDLILMGTTAFSTSALTLVLSLLKRTYGRRRPAKRALFNSPDIPMAPHGAGLLLDQNP
jgi:hypothetical protein